MYSSLDRIDISLHPAADGRERHVQTDHRTAEEIAREPELSIIFALTRILNPRRARVEGGLEPVVIYSMLREPPEFFRRAVRAAGGLLLVGEDSLAEFVATGEGDLAGGESSGSVPDQGEHLSLGVVIESAFAGLAGAVAREHGVDATLDGIEALERALAPAAGDREKDEIAYWSAVVKLGCFGGELIRATNGGRWHAAEMGTLPFALSTGFQGGQATVNPLGKAMKRFANGEDDTIVRLVRLIQSLP